MVEVAKKQVETTAKAIVIRKLFFFNYRVVKDEHDRILYHFKYYID